MPTSLQLALATFGAMLALTPIVRAIAVRAGAVDRPGPRRVHADPVPTLGGLAMVASVLGVGWLFHALPGELRQLDTHPLLGLSLASLPLLGLGLIDDTAGVPARAKLGVQVLSGVILAGFGYRVALITNPFGEPLVAGWLGVPLAVVWVVIVINAINLIDGLDGLASGVVLIAAASLWWVGHGRGDIYVMFLSALLIGTTAGFLVFNFPPAKIFMGDTGSHFLGLVLAAASLLEHRKAATTAALLFPLTALAVPLADSLFAFIRRLRAGRPVFSADREHLHHRLLRIGYSPRRATLALWALCAACGGFSVLLERLPHTTGLLLVGLTIVVLSVIYRRIGRGRSTPPASGGA